MYNIWFEEKIYGETGSLKEQKYFKFTGGL